MGGIRRNGALRFKNLFRYAEHIVLDLLRIGGNAAFKHRRSTRHLGQLARKQTRRAGFGRGDLHLFFFQKANDCRLQIVHV